MENNSIIPKQKIYLIYLFKTTTFMESNNIFGIQDDGKTAGLLSYFFVLGWSVSYFTFHKNDKTSLSSYHLRQTLFLYLSYVVIRFGLYLFLSHVWLSTGIFSLYYLTMLINFTFIALWVTGLMGAINGEKNQYHCWPGQHKAYFRVFNK